MAPSSMKYNPAFLDDDRLIQSFVARNAELETILEVLRENTANSNQHLLIIGPRGIGKTTLVLRSAAEIRTDSTLGAQLHPVVFGEETYQVSSPGEFWLETLFHLGEQTGDPRWKKAYEELRLERDEGRLRARVLAQLMDFADEQGKRLVLVVENLNMLVGDQITGDDAWVLRHTLMNEPRLMLLGTATSRFKEVEEYNQALYDLFRIVELEPLEDVEVQALWTATTGQGTTARQIRPLQILTGGNPRLIRILSEFAANTSFSSLMDDLTRLVDEHTEYFKHHLDNLPVQERKIFVALADLWDPSTSRKVAEAARLDVNTASAMLKRLMGRGAVTMAYKRGKAQYYQVAERMYNIYHLMRRRGPAASRVHAVVRFMVSLYRDEELVRTARSLVEEASRLTLDERREHFLAYEAILHYTRKPRLAKQLVEATRLVFETMPDVPESLQQTIRLAQKSESNQRAKLSTSNTEGSVELRLGDVDDVDSLVRMGNLLSEHPDRLEEAEAAFRKAIQKDPDNASTWRALGFFLGSRMQGGQDALNSFDHALALEPEHATAWLGRAVVLEMLGRKEEALESNDRALSLAPDNASAWLHKSGVLYELGQFEAALQSADQALALDLDSAATWFCRGRSLDQLGRHEDALASYDRSLDLAPDDPVVWLNKGGVLYEMGRFEAALQAVDQALALDVEDAATWFNRSLALDRLDRHTEALQSSERALALDPEDGEAWLNRGAVLFRIGEYEQALESFDRVLALDAENALAWSNRGVALRLLRREEEALDSLDRALALDPRVVPAWLNRSLILSRLGRNQQALESVNRVLLLDSANVPGWSLKGTVLSSLDRFEEALDACDRALMLDPDNASTWGTKGRVLESLGRYEEALAAYGRALATDPENSSILLLRGLINRRLKHFREAESDLREAIALGVTGDFALITLVALLMENLDSPGEALTAVRECLDRIGRSPDALNSIAWAFSKHGRKEDLAEAETWARRAVEQVPESGYFRHTLASLLGAQGKWKDALEQAAIFLTDQQMLTEALDEVIEFFVDAVAAGYDNEVLNTLGVSASAEALEPLVVAIQQRTGAQIDVAREILEVAKDVSSRIDARRSQLQAT